MSLPARLPHCNETVLHCLSTKCLAWRNTEVISAACWLPLVSKRLLPFSLMRDLQALPHRAKQLSGFHQLFSTCCLQGSPDKLWWWMQSEYGKYTVINLYNTFNISWSGNENQSDLNAGINSEFSAHLLVHTVGNKQNHKNTLLVKKPLKGLQKSLCLYCVNTHVMWKCFACSPWSLKWLFFYYE